MYSVHAIKFILFVKIKQNKGIVIVYLVIMSSKCELQKMPKTIKVRQKIHILNYLRLWEDVIFT